MSSGRQPEPEYRFRFSLGRMLILMAAIGAWLASLTSVPWPWLVWLASVIFYLAVSLCFSAERR
jgi:hypothetical protein